jgi:hypothetical protein
MASADVLRPVPVDSFFNSHDLTLKRKRSESTMPNMITALAGDAPKKIAFDPKKHLNFVPPERIWTMKDIGFEDIGVSDTAVSQPFSLFTEDAIKQMRAEILSKPVFENCQYSSNLAACQLRGFAVE